ncbi:MAG: hypothetical protein OHK0021_22640 [Bryobacter sp.]
MAQQLTANQRGLLVAAVGLAVAAGFLAFTWIRQQQAVGDSPLAYVPSEGGSVIRLRVDMLRSAGLFQMSKIPKEGEYQEFIAATGFDFERDLDEIVLWISAEENYYIARGRFAWPKLREYVNANGGRCVDRVCTMAASQAGKSLSFFPLGPDLLGVALSKDPYAAAMLKKGEKPLPLPCPAESPAAISLRPVELQPWFRQHEGLKEMARAELCLNAEDRAATVQLQFVLHGEEQAERLAPSFQEMVTRLGGEKTEVEGKRVWAKWTLEWEKLAALFAEGEKR